MTREEDLSKALKVAEVVANRYCARFGVRAWLRDDVKQIAAMIAIEKLDSVPEPLDEHLNWIARTVYLRLLDEFKKDQRRRRREILERDINVEDGAGAIECFWGNDVDPDILLESEQERARFWETVDVVLELFGKTEQEIIKRRVLMNESFKSVKQATGADNKEIRRVVKMFHERLRERL
ncbi:MAG: sigma-70 family RNA polymerase sigma factor [Thermoguttaceae bacterium]|nr:sigma-70 family RNA polymerase sigma factor [Thermoguttaceae bacterium]